MKDLSNNRANKSFGKNIIQLIVYGVIVVAYLQVQREPYGHCSVTVSAAAVGGGKIRNNGGSSEYKADYVVEIPKQSGTSLVLAFGSCHKTKYRDPTIWRTIVNKSEPDGFLWLGDSIYPPVRGLASLDQIEDEYRRMLHDETIGYTKFLQYIGLKNFHRISTSFQRRKILADDVVVNDDETPTHAFYSRDRPVFGVWDDHDYGGNDMGDEMPYRYERSKLFWKFLGKTAPIPQRDGIYYSVDFRTRLPRPGEHDEEIEDEDEDEEGNGSSKANNYQGEEDGLTVRVIFLDTRWNRGPHCIPAATGKVPLGAGIACFTRWISAGLFPRYCQSKEMTILGTKQWRWLEQVLLSTAANSADIDVLVIASSIQVFTTNPAMESWGQYPSERKRLLKLLTSSVSSKVQTIILSGDVHHGEIIDPKAAYKDQRSLLDPSASIDEDKVRSIYEVTSSALTHSCSNGIYGFVCEPLLQTFHKHRYANRNNYYVGRNYGTITIGTDKANINSSTTKSSDQGTRFLSVNIHAVETGTVVLSVPTLPIVRYNDTNDDISSRILADHWSEDDLDSVYSCMDGHLLPYVPPVLIIIGGIILTVVLYVYLEYKRIVFQANKTKIS